MPPPPKGPVVAEERQPGKTVCFRTTTGTNSFLPTVRVIAGVSMEDNIPSISEGSVGSRFVSQSELETAKARRDEQWKAAYARLGQEPPPQPQEDVFDGRSLAEKLAANRPNKKNGRSAIN